MVNIDFPNWLFSELESRGWSQADLARKSGVTTAGISRILTGERNPGTEVCQSIAQAFGYPPEIVFRAAGLLPPKPSHEIEMEEWHYILEKLSETDRAELLEIARVKLKNTDATLNQFTDLYMRSDEEVQRTLRDQMVEITKSLYELGLRREK